MYVVTYMYIVSSPDAPISTVAPPTTAALPSVTGTRCVSATNHTTQVLSNPLSLFASMPLYSRLSTKRNTISCTQISTTRYGRHLFLLSRFTVACSKTEKSCTHRSDPQWQTLQTDALKHLSNFRKKHVILFVCIKGNFDILSYSNLRTNEMHVAYWLRTLAALNAIY